MYTIDEFIRDYDAKGNVEKAIVNCLVENMTKEVALDVLANDLQKRLYGFIYNSKEFDIDDGRVMLRDILPK